MKHDRFLAAAAFATVCVVWGTTYLAIRVAIETVPPLMLTSIRFTIAGGVMLAIARLRGERAPLDRRTLGELALIGLLMVGIGNLAVAWAEQWVPSGIAALLVATSPFWSAIIERLRPRGERLALRSAFGMLIGFGGVALLVGPSAFSGGVGGKFLLGALAIQVGTFAWQLGSFRGKYQAKHVPLLTSAALQMFFGGAIVGVVGLALGEHAALAFTGKTFAATAYLTVMGSIVAYSAYVYAVAHIRLTKLALYAYINPAIAVIAGWLVLDERLTPLSIAAMAIILGGVALVQTAPGRGGAGAAGVEPAEQKDAA